MKPPIADKRCFAGQSVCKVIKARPVEAISYIEVDEPIMDKNCKKIMWQEHVPAILQWNE